MATDKPSFLTIKIANNGEFIRKYNSLSAQICPLLTQFKIYDSRDFQMHDSAEQNPRWLFFIQQQ